MKVFKLPEFAPNARGKPMIGIFPLDKDENITTVLPLPKDTNIWEELNIVFATSKGSVRRNALSDFIKIPLIASGGVGKIEHFYDGVNKGKANALLAASVFHFNEISIKEVKEYLSSRDINVRK